MKVRKFAGQNVSNENIYVCNSAVVGNKQSFSAFPIAVVIMRISSAQNQEVQLFC